MKSWNGTVQKLKNIDPDREQVARFPLETNRMMYRQWRKELKDFAFRLGLSISVEENKGLFGVTLQVRIRGPVRDILRFLKALEAHPDSV
jgi:hypothetical protein